MSRVLSAPWVEVLSAILRGAPNLPNAACRNQPRLFDADHPDEAEREQQQLLALDICQTCPERGPCGAWLDSLPTRRRPPGVIAGQIDRPR